MFGTLVWAKTGKRLALDNTDGGFYDVVHLLQFNLAKKVREFSERLKTIKDFLE